MVVVESFVPLELWQKCMDILQDEVQLQQFNTWLRPLKVMADDDALCLLAPNRFVLDWIKDKFLPRIEEVMDELSAGNPPTIALGVTTRKPSFSSRYRSTRQPVNNRNASELTIGSSKAKFKPQEEPLAGRENYLSGLKKKAAIFKAEHTISHDQFVDPSAYNVQKSLDLGGAATASHSHIQEQAQFSESIHSSASTSADHQVLIRSDVSRFYNPLRSHPDLPASAGTSKVVSSALSSMRSSDSTALLEQDEEPSRFSTSTRRPVADASFLKREEPVHEKRIQHTTPWPGIKSHTQSSSQSSRRQVDVEGRLQHNSSLNKSFTFDTFVEGKSNQLALAAARQIVENPGAAYNPLFLYGGVGLGKTHLMHAVGNHLVQKSSKSNVVYLHSERFVADMVKALQLNAINDFKRYYRSVDALLIDDIQFFSGKDRSQEEFFHTFNALLEGGQQVILTCDRYPKEINGLEERLKSRFSWGLTVAVEPPELETRVAILMKKAEQANVILPSEAAFFIAQRLRSNVRELEGALKRVIASAHFMGVPIDIDLIREALKDLLALQDKLVSIDNIQRTVAEHYQIKMSDILSKTRARAVARPRQISMALAKELTSHSLPEIGDAHGGRDHTTVLHACRKVKELISIDNGIANDYQQLLKSLTN